jgi:predicted TPR repeat methyltransferase
MKKRKKTKAASTINSAITLHKNGNIEKAIPLYKNVLSKTPGHPDALHYLGLALYQKGNAQAAITHIKRAIAISPTYPDALNNLGNIYKETGDLENASLIYRQIIDLAPNHTDTRINLAGILRDTKQTKEALTHLQKALEIDPSSIKAYYQMANIYSDASQPELALQAYQKALEIEPSSNIAHYEMGNIYSEATQPELALQAYQKALAVDPFDIDTITQTVKVLNNLGRINEAQDILRTFLKHQPEDPIAKHMLASLGGSKIPSRADDQYIKQTFDEFANSFDNILAKLNYKAPELVSARLNQMFDGKSSKIDILDLGCGTGLCGPLLKPISNRLVGIDLSANMLKKAALRSVYDHLEEVELTHFMESSEQHYNAVVCVDTLIYFGDLSAAFAAANKVLVLDGYIVFTLERHSQNNQSYHLQKHGRYSHSKDYVRSTLVDNGFRVISIDNIVPRTEHGKPVDGILLVAKKTQ